jgi:hypothetical protein
VLSTKRIDMTRCISTGNVAIAGSSMDPTFFYKKARKQRQSGAMINDTQHASNNDSSSQSAVNAIISSVANSKVSQEAVCNNCICNELKLELKVIKEVIVQLQTKLDFLMSYLGLTDNGNNTTVPDC